MAKEISLWTKSLMSGTTDLRVTFFTKDSLKEKSVIVFNRDDRQLRHKNMNTQRVEDVRTFHFKIDEKLMPKEYLKGLPTKVVEEKDIRVRVYSSGTSQFTWDVCYFSNEIGLFMPEEEQVIEKLSLWTQTLFGVEARYVVYGQRVDWSTGTKIVMELKDYLRKSGIIASISREWVFDVNYFQHGGKTQEMIISGNFDIDLLISLLPPKESKIKSGWLSNLFKKPEEPIRFSMREIDREGNLLKNSPDLYYTEGDGIFRSNEE